MLFLVYSLAPYSWGLGVGFYGLGAFRCSRFGVTLSLLLSRVCLVAFIGFINVINVLNTLRALASLCLAIGQKLAFLLSIGRAVAFLGLSWVFYRGAFFSWLSWAVSFLGGLFGCQVDRSAILRHKKRGLYIALSFLLSRLSFVIAFYLFFG